MNARVDSFARGATKEECENFVMEIIQKGVDVAIFDENLEYHDGGLSGSLLGKKSRELGFKGCLILHSAQIEEASIFLQDGVFDGFVEKTSSRKIFAQGVIQVWAKHLVKRSKLF